MLEVVKSTAFDRWLGRLRDGVTKARIDKHVMRVQMAGRYVGDWKPVGGGVVEVRLDFGPGYRIYLSIEGGRVLLLLAGGEKHGQRGDIEMARELLAKWRRENG